MEIQELMDLSESLEEFINQRQEHVTEDTEISMKLTLREINEVLERKLIQTL